MPLPIIMGIGAAVAAVGGVGTGVNGGFKMKTAKDTLERATKKRDEAIASFEKKNLATTAVMDELGEKELQICMQFEEFADLIEQIQNRPKFKELNKDKVSIPKYDPEEMKKVSVGASVVLGSLGGSAAGTAAGFAAAGATTTAIMTFGTASTGTAIGTLSGAAATNATLAALGGGSIAAGGGGVALGSTMLGVSTAGIGILVGGIIFNITGTGLSKKADQAYYEALEIERKVININSYLDDLEKQAIKYEKALDAVTKVYKKTFKEMQRIVINEKKTDWLEFTDDDKLIVQNGVLLVGLLYKMCKVALVKKIKTSSGEETNIVNYDETNINMTESETILNNMEV